MPDRPDPHLDAETIRRFASEQVKITLTESEVDALKTTLNGLLDEIRLMAPNDRKAAEPETGVIVQEWPSLGRTAGAPQHHRGLPCALAVV